MKKIYAVFLARLREFYRDTASLGWNFIFPFFIVIGFYYIFTNEDQVIYKVGTIEPLAVTETHPDFFKLKHVAFVPVSREEGLNKIRNHKLDMLVGEGNPLPYWINSDSQNGYFLEKILLGSVDGPVVKEVVSGQEVSYVNWVIPGVLAMNLMFSCLWGVGWVVVKYRQEGYLKRLYATPLKAYQFLIGQLAARYVIAFFVTLIVFVGCKWLVGFEMKGSYLDLLVVFTFGVTSLIALGLAVAFRTTSKEFADGILNVLSWPMMLLSEVWFSLEGSSEWVIAAANVLPLTHMVKAARQVMVEGATLVDVWEHLVIMGITAVVLITITSLLFKWSPE